MLRADLHVHTNFSPDSSLSPEGLLAHCRELGINCLAVTDHNTIAGAIRMQEISTFPIIIGEEVRTTHGEIIGFFLNEGVPRGLPPEEAVARIKEQGGLVGVSHPFDRFRRRSALHPQALARLLPSLDFIEAFNSRTILLRDSNRAHRFAQAHNLLTTAGSDAHTTWELGGAYIEMPEFDGPESFRDSLAQGRIFGRRTNPLIHFRTLATRLAKRWRRRQDIV